ncbi:MocE family 2Fe-2S type ferredoxin [Acidocella sp.]|uniref:MocE family 2Fe-2S type ferredoxin n=1 Tax=Acidocella sp. TaxID=50710 RepID=UPI002613A35A|nr:MocE family 2Fe-2S type ferredoxin [Acidocella sp.]
MTKILDLCACDDVELEDVIRVDQDGLSFAVFRSPDDKFYVTDGMCTHENVPLSGGLVMDHIIECPKHNGRFDYRTGQAKGAPVCVNLRTYPVTLANGRVSVTVS